VTRDCSGCGSKRASGGKKPASLTLKYLSEF